MIANLSTGRGAGADLDAAIAAAECAAIACGNGEAMLWRSGALGVYNEVVITGPPPTPREWGPAGGLPSELGQYKGSGTRCARAAGEDTRLDPRSLNRAPSGSGRAARARRGADRGASNRSL